MSKAKSSKSSKSPLVIGVDFGMTFTGVAWAHNISMEPRILQDGWPGAETSAEKKVPTVVVYDNSGDTESIILRKAPVKKKLSSWGFKAVKSKESYLEDREIKDHFKLFLDDKFVSALLRDNASFTQVEVHQWYEDFLKEVYHHIKYHFTHSKPKLWAGDVEFVFSVPTTWKENVIGRFKDRIRNAGFGKEPRHRFNVTLTEAHAVAIQTAMEKESEIEEGNLLLNVDAGGGTTDIALLEVASKDDEDDISLAQIDAVSGIDVGATQIDLEFKNYARKRLKILNQEHPGLINDIESAIRKMAGSSEFQVQKCGLGSDLTTIPFGIPIPSLRPDISVPKANIKDGELTYTPKKMAAIFDKILKPIYQAIDNQFSRLATLKGHQHKQVTYMILSGGLGSSRYVYNKLSERYCSAGKQAFNNGKKITLLQAEDPRLVVAKGLVLERLQTLGKSGPTLRNWVARKSYGIRHVQRYNPNKHLAQDRDDSQKHLTGEETALNQITWVVKKGDPLTSKSEKYFPCIRRFDPDGDDHRIWHSYMVTSDNDVEDLPSSTSQGGTQPFCVIESDFGRVNLEDFNLESRGWFWRGKSHIVAHYRIKVLLGPADLKFELYFKGEMMSTEKDISVAWDDDRGLEELLGDLHM